MAEGNPLMLRVSVSDKGAIVAGKHVEIDGYASKRFRVVTHFHSDHLLGLRRSAERASMIIATPPTLDALDVLGYKVPVNKSVPLEYGRPLRLCDESLVLVRSKHIFGSAQVLVESGDGVRIGYTGDFKLPGTPVMKDLDILVIDATYGGKRMVRPFEDEVRDYLLDIVSSSLSRGVPVRILGYYGKMQEVMSLLRRMGVSAPFLMSSKLYKLTEVAVKHGVRISDYYSLEGEEAGEILRSGWYILFQHVNARRKILGRSVTIYLSGWLFSSPARRLRSGNYHEEWWVAFSDHSDFRGTLKYVVEARPRLLIVDSYRAGEAVAREFAEAAAREAGVKTIVLPGVRKGRIRRED